MSPKYSLTYCCQPGIWGTTEKQQFYKKKGKNKKHGKSSHFFSVLLYQNFKEFVFIILIKTGWTLEDLEETGGIMNEIKVHCMKLSKINLNYILKTHYYPTPQK